MSRPTQDTTRNNSHLPIRDYHPLWFNFPVDSNSWNISHRGPTTPTFPISLAATIGIINYFLFLRVLRCFSSPGLLLSVTGLQPAGLPHSEIYVSKVMCTSS
jgi:hypothetical protein